MARPTGVDLDLAAFLAGEAHNDAQLTQGLADCGCPVCTEALRILDAELIEASKSVRFVDIEDPLAGRLV
jgi:hypothetical protein